MIPMPAHSSSVATSAEPCSLRGRALATFFGLLLVGCSGGGDSGGSPPGGSGNIISGTAATGDPIALGTITIKDSLGVPRSTVTDRNGNYSFNVAGTTPPFILKAVPKAAGSVPLYSFAGRSGTTNITPLTDLALYEALGRSDIGTVFDSGNLSQLTVSSVNAAETMVRSNYQTQLTANGLSTATDLFHTPFVANGTGQDAVIQNTLVTKLGTGGLYINDSGNLCVPYGRNNNGVTFAINGIHEDFLFRFFGFEPPPVVSSDAYVKTALESHACTPRNIVHIHWTGDQEETLVAIAFLKKALRDANKDEPINIVSHSWGSVIAYIALSELASPTEEQPGDRLIRVANLITMGSPIQYLDDNPDNAVALPLTDFLGQGIVSSIQAFVPLRFSYPNRIQQPGNVTKWINYYGPNDIISRRIGALGDQGNKYVRCTGDIVDPSQGPGIFPCNVLESAVVQAIPGTVSLALLESGKNHGTQYGLATGNSRMPVLDDVYWLISASQSSTSPVPPVVQLPATVALLKPGVFTVTAGVPYCDTREPVGPAVKLTWSVSTNSSFYRVFRDGRATGVQLGSSQLDFVNELGLVAGQSYSYMIKATNASGETWSSPAQVTIPADVCSLDFISPSPGTINTSAVGYQPTLTASGNVTQVDFVWSGATSGSTTWFRNDTNWLSKVTSNPDGSMTLRPVVTHSSDAPGITNWTVTIRDSTRATRTQSFSVNYQPTTTGGGGDILLPDLVVDTVTATPTTSAAPGASVTVTFTVRNQGAGAIGTTTARIRLASGTTIQLTDPLLAEVTVPGLAAGVTNTQSRTVTVPAGTSTGNYFMGVTANAPDGAPAESNNNNNQRTTPFTVAGGGGTGPSLPQPFTLPNATAQCDLNTPVGPAVRLNWFASGNATSYEVYRNDTLIPASVNNTTLTFYNSSGLTAGQTYTYRVVARNAAGTIDSNTITVSIPSTICGSPARTVTIANTGGIGLNLRNGPGENFSVLRALPEGTQMSVVGGPTLANGMTWWNLTDSQGTGWSAVAEWLTPLTPALNSQVTVTFTGNIGLRLRQCAGVSCTLITTLPEGTTMTVIAGPVSASGYTWWNLTGPQGTGWSAVGNWLTPNPRS